MKFIIALLLLSGCATSDEHKSLAHDVSVLKRDLKNAQLEIRDLENWADWHVIRHPEKIPVDPFTQAAQEAADHVDRMHCDDCRYGKLPSSICEFLNCE